MQKQWLYCWVWDGYSNLLDDMDAISTHAVLTYLSAYSLCSVWNGFWPCSQASCPAHVSLWNWQILPSLWRSGALRLVLTNGITYSACASLWSLTSLNIVHGKHWFQLLEHVCWSFTLICMARSVHARLWNWKNVTIISLRGSLQLLWNGYWL